MKSDITDVECIYIHHTEKAVKVAAYEGAESVWIPNYACEWERDPNRPYIVIVTAKQSILEEKGLV